MTYGGSLFDRFAKSISAFAGHPAAFAAALALIGVWLASGPLFGYSNTWQLVINTATTIVTFLLVALLQNSARRSDRAVHHKLDALADGLADLMEHVAPGNDDLQADMRDLRSAVGLEKPKR